MISPRSSKVLTGPNAIALSPRTQYRAQHQQPQHHHEQQQHSGSRRVSPASSAGGKTYADYFTASTAASGTQSRGPVRITISKSARYSIDPTSGLPIYEEVWEEEEIMDVVSEHDPRQSTDLNPQIVMPASKRTSPSHSPRQALVDLPAYPSSSTDLNPHVSFTPSKPRSPRDSPRATPSRLPAKPPSAPINRPPRHVFEEDRAPQGRDLDESAEGGHRMVITSSFVQVQNNSTGLHAVDRGPSIMVLDTNTLIAHFVFLRTLFSLLLVRNLNALLLRSVWPPNTPFPTHAMPSDLRPAPFRLVLPHIVIQELDGLKSQRNDAGTNARQANRWILACLQAQKRTVSAFLTKESSALIMEAALGAGADRAQVAAAAETVLASPMPPETWALHFETSRQYRDRVRNDERGSDSRKTNDERIVELCVSLASSTSLPVWLLSNDTNARTHAEIEGIRALELDNIIREPTKPPPPAFAKPTMGNTPDWASTGQDGVRYSAKKSQKREVSDTVTAARELIEQWDTQVGYVDDANMNGGKAISHRQGSEFDPDPFARPRSPLPAYRSSSPSMDEDGDDSMEF